MIELPRFVDKNQAISAIIQVIGFYQNNPFFSEMKMRDSDLLHCHVVILVPAREGHEQKSQSVPYELSQVSLGKTADWKYAYDQIAISKAYQLWYGRNDGTGPTPAHLLIQDDTPYWGGVKRDGIVVACSGFDEWVDKMLSGMIADVLIAAARQEQESTKMSG